MLNNYYNENITAADGPLLSSEYTFDDKSSPPRVQARRRLGTSQTPAVGNIAQFRRKLSTNIGGL